MSESRPVTQPTAIAATIRRLRLEQGLTQEALAQALGVSSQAVSKWENGQTMPDITLLLSLSKELNIGINELLGGNRRQELMQQFIHATHFGDEFVLIACEKALEEFPDDEMFLRERATAQLNIGKKDYMRRERFIRMAIHEFYLLSSKYPNNPEYPAKMAQGYLALGDRERAVSTMLNYSGPNKEMWMEPFWDEETRTIKKQKKIQKCFRELYSALRDYGSRESLEAAHTLLETLAGEEKKLLEPAFWELSLKEAILCRDEGDNEGYTAHLTKAYEQARAADAMLREETPYKSPLFDRLRFDPKVYDGIVSQTSIFLNLHHNLFAHSAAVSLKKRILDEMVRCIPLERYHFLYYLQFCIDHINTANYVNYSICWDMTEEEFSTMQKEFFKNPCQSKYGGVLMQTIHHGVAERLCRDGILKGYVATHYNNIIAFCNCKEKSSYKRLAIPEEGCTDTAPEGSKILAIAELLISHDYRDCGLEEKLLDCVLTNAKQQGYTHVEAYPMENCLPEMFEKLLACYKRMGFHIIREVVVNRRIPGDEDLERHKRYILQKEL